MCVNNQNTTPEQIESMKALATELGEAPLGSLLTALSEMLEQGGNICLGIMPSEQEIAAARAAQQQQFVPQQQALPAGITPPGPQPDVPSQGYGNYL